MITLYVTPTCPWCKKTKEWLRKKKLKFTEKDILEEEEWRDEVLQKTGQLAIPVIDMDGIILVGFDEKKLEEAAAHLKEKIIKTAA